MVYRPQMQMQAIVGIKTGRLSCRLIGCVVTCVDGVWTMVIENVAAPEAHGRKKLGTPAHFGGRKITNNIKS